MVPAHHRSHPWILGISYAEILYKIVEAYNKGFFLVTLKILFRWHTKPHDGRKKEY